MAVISIREQGKTDLGFHASLVFEGREYPVVITEPFTTQEEKQLEWYFKGWMVSPFRDIVRAQQVASSIRTYGERLFQQLFQDKQAYGEYQKRRAASLSQLQFEIVATTPEFHALHWEALRDPDLPRPLAVDCIILRKNSQPAHPSLSASTRPSPVINVLVVVARPDEENDVGSRTISRPLIEAIKNRQLRVNVEFLSPGTYQALSQHLEQKGVGYYHIVHFDTRMSLMTYGQVQEGVANRYIYQERWGRYHFQPYDGVKAFVFLEGESKGKSDLVDAKELKDLLIDKRIPVCFFHACQSDEQGYSAQYTHQVTSDRSGQTSLGSQLMAEGIQMVVTMGYGMTVSATKLMIEKVYTHLFDDKGITEAIRLGRRELFLNKSRKAYFNKFIDLEDWLFPV
ncbi:CHAT domain-containing protein, partial [Aetokthonos hydrillicola]